MIKEICNEERYTGGKCENEERICLCKMPVAFSYFISKRVVPRFQSGSTFIFMYSGATRKKLVRKVTLNIFVEKTIPFSPTAKRKVIFKQILDLKVLSLM